MIRQAGLFLVVACEAVFMISPPLDWACGNALGRACPSI